MKRTLIKLGVTLVITVLFCVSAVAQNDLKGTKWNWVGTIMRDTRTAVEDPSKYTVAFVTDTAASLLADCNKGQGSYKVDGNNLTFGPFAMTMMACPPGSHGSLFSQSISTAKTYKNLGGRILMIDIANGATLFFTRAETTQAILTGTTWTWQGTQTPVEKITVPNPLKYTLTFLADGTVQVRADCNTGTGSYTVEGNTLTFGPNFAMTRAMCPPGSLDTKFMQSLVGARTYKVEGNNLAIGLVADSGTMLFTGAASSASSAGLVGPKWYWVGTQSQVDPVKVAQPIKYTLEFLSSGTVNVKADCNTGSGTYKVEGDHITFGPIGMTRMACPPGSQDTQFLQGLSAVRTFNVDGNNMMFVLNNGSSMLFSSAAPASD
jgi:heat shock protein HslJ